MNINKLRSAVILSAGIGKRLRPLTDFIPKPLFPVNNTPAIQLIIDKLKTITVQDFCFNTYHLAGEITQFLDGQKDLNKTIVNERILRNTGGGIANFWDKLENETFILHNCDVYCEEDLPNLIEFHFQLDALATLMVVDYPPINSVRMDNERISDFKSNDGNCTYSGIAIFSPGIWKFFPSDEVFSIIPVLQDAINSGEKIAAFKSSAYWNDIGTPLRYWELHRHLCSGTGEFIDKTAVVEKCELKGFNFVSTGAVIRDCILEDCIVFPRTSLSDVDLKSCIIHRYCRVQVHNE